LWSSNEALSNSTFAFCLGSFPGSLFVPEFCFAGRFGLEAVLVAFLAGVFLDLARGTPLGLSSLIFLLVSFILSLYSRKYDPLHPAFLPVFTFLSAISYQLLTINYPDWREGLILALLVILARPLIGYFSLGSTRGEIKLKV
jgi:rod shape-determining protein MreD